MVGRQRGGTSAAGFSLSRGQRQRDGGRKKPLWDDTLDSERFFLSDVLHVLNCVLEIPAGCRWILFTPPYTVSGSGRRSLYSFSDVGVCPASCPPESLYFFIKPGSLHCPFLINPICCCDIMNAVCVCSLTAVHILLSLC